MDHNVIRGRNDDWNGADRRSEGRSDDPGGQMRQLEAGEIWTYPPEA